MSPCDPSRRALLVVLATLLVVGPVGAAAPLPQQADAPVPDLETAEGMPNMLQPSEASPTVEGFETADADLAAAIAASTHESRSDLAIRVYRERMDGSTSVAQRRITDDRLTALGEAVDRLQARETALRRGYRNGSLERATFLRRYGLVQAAADRLASRLAGIERYLEQSAAPDLISVFWDRLRLIEGRIATLESPVRNRALSALSGAESAAMLYVVAGGDAGVAATYDDGTYYREATVEANRDPESPDQFEQQTDYEVSPAVDRAFELYPWVGNNSLKSVPDFDQLGSLYRVTIGHQMGRLFTYLDGGTTNVYHEVQRLRPGAVPTTDETVNRTDALTLSGASTAPTGPMRVSVTQTSSEAPLSATVRIDGQPVGETDGSGVLWTIQPRGAYNVTATHDGNVVTIQGP